jgi:hypothetical protein
MSSKEQPLCKHRWPRMVAALQTALADGDNPSHLRGTVAAWIGESGDAADSAPAMVSWPCHECEAVAQERRIQRAVKRAAKKARVENLSAKWK